MTKEQLEKFKKMYKTYTIKTEAKGVTLGLNYLKAAELYLLVNDIEFGEVVFLKQNYFNNTFTIDFWGNDLTCIDYVEVSPNDMEDMIHFITKGE